MLGIFKKKEEKTDADLLDLVSDSEKARAKLLEKRYQAGVNYLRAQGYYDQWPEYDRFWNSQQWPAVTEKTKKYPRPVTNYFASIIEQKIAGVTYDMPEIYYDPVDAQQITRVELQRADLAGEVEDVPSDIDAAEALSHVANHQWEAMNMEDKIDQKCRSAAVLGVGILHFPWDNTITGGGPNSAYIGDIACREIDPADFFPGNPYDADIQSQPYILVGERIPLAEARERYESTAGEKVYLLKPEGKTNDREIYDQQRTELDQTDYVDLIHCWEKVPVEGRAPTPSESGIPDEFMGEDGDHEDKGKSQKLRDRKEDRAATPTEEIEEGEEVEEGEEGDALDDIELVEYRLEYSVTCQSIVLRYEEELYEHGLYPFTAFQWYPRRFSFYGKAESADLINNQKEENRLAGISLVCAYQTGLPNLLYKEGFINRNQIPDGPGGAAIEDNSPPGQWGASYLHPPTPAAHIPQLRETIVQGMKDGAGVHEAWEGKMEGSQLNASAIIALQEAAGIRIRGIQRRLRKSLREAAQIWLAHWKEFVEEDRFIKILGEKRVKGYFWFRGTHYREMEFDVRVQAGSASPFSRSLMTAQLDKMHERGIIDGEEYLECIPTDVFPQGEKIIQRRHEAKQQQRELLQRQKQALVTHMVEQTMEQARAQDVEVTPEALQEMLRMVDDIAMQTMEDLEAQQEQGRRRGPTPLGGGGALPTPEDPDAEEPRVGGDEARGEAAAHLMGGDTGY